MDTTTRAQPQARRPTPRRPARQPERPQARPLLQAQPRRPLRGAPEDVAALRPQRASCFRQPHRRGAPRRPQDQRPPPLPPPPDHDRALSHQGAPSLTVTRSSPTAPPRTVSAGFVFRFFANRIRAWKPPSQLRIRISKRMPPMLHSVSEDHSIDAMSKLPRFHRESTPKLHRLAPGTETKKNRVRATQFHAMQSPVHGEPVPVHGEPVPVHGEPVEPRPSRRNGP